MTTQLAAVTAEIIKKCFSEESLALAAQELGVSIPPKCDIFEALIRAGKAADFRRAVRIVSAHLEVGQGVEPESNEGTAERRIPRQIQR
ncbi:MAG: hypothetical protein NVSMB6_10140 [Burkholderiaceae bacterium]